MTVAVSIITEMRIESASKDSPIAVFYGRRDGYYRSVFHNTYRTMQEMSSPQYIGSFYGAKGAALFDVAIKNFEQ